MEFLSKIWEAFGGFIIKSILGLVVVVSVVVALNAIGAENQKMINYADNSVSIAGR